MKPATAQIQTQAQAQTHTQSHTQAHIQSQAQVHIQSQAQVHIQSQAQAHIQSQERLNNRAALLKALAHPTRLWLVEQLEHQERCVCELTDGVDADISTVSKHLSLLRQAGIVASRREGKQIYYRLETPCLLGMLSCIETALAQSPGCCAKSSSGKGYESKTDKAKPIQSVR